jgi:hypothetical protein
MTEPDNDAFTSPNKLPDQVFHYTSIDTMMKIVSSRSIWCTALPYLNDSKERTFLFDAVKQRLPFLKQQDSSIPPELGLQSLEAEDVTNLTSFADEAFVACFAEKSDSLMHWRAYCPQQNGVAIGFRSACLDEAQIAEKPEAGMVVPRVLFARVGYLNTEDPAVIDAVIRTAYYVAKKEVDKGHSWGDLNDHFRWTLDTMACLSKEKAFEVEDELRLLLPYVRYRENNIQFRTVRSTLIPYVEMAVHNHSATGVVFDFDKKLTWNAIQSVVIGPTANMELTRRSIEAFFALRRMEVEVLESKVPYRDW